MGLSPKATAAAVFHDVALSDPGRAPRALGQAGVATQPLALFTAIAPDRARAGLCRRHGGVHAAPPEPGRRFQVVSRRYAEKSILITRSLPTGVTSSPTPRRWSPWWTAWSITRRSSTLRASRIASRRLANALSAANGPLQRAPTLACRRQTESPFGGAKPRPPNQPPTTDPRPFPARIGATLRQSRCHAQHFRQPQPNFWAPPPAAPLRKKPVLRASSGPATTSYNSLCLPCGTALNT